jgi:hypothetical protein
MKIDIHSHILPKEWPDLEKVMVINLLNYFWNFSRVSPMPLFIDLSLLWGSGCFFALGIILNYLVDLIS